MTVSPALRLAPIRSSRPAEAVAVLLWEKTAFPAQPLPETWADPITAALARPEYRAARGEMLALYPSHTPGHLLLAGLGHPQTDPLGGWRTAGAQIRRAAARARVRRLEILLPESLADLSPAACAQALAEGLNIGGFHFDELKGAARREEGAIGHEEPLEVILVPAFRAGFERGLALGAGITTARRLAATPPNLAGPDRIEAECRRLATDVGLSMQVIDAKKAKALGMGGLCAVGQGGSQPPRLIALSWPGQRATRNASSKPVAKKAARRTVESRSAAGRGATHTAPWLLVGKGITFDTGGYSLKVGGTMREMKYDKCGAMAVIGAMEAIARLQFPEPVVAVLAVAENLVDRKAFRVDDILHLYNGVTVEVTNTDAEGRLVLADALAWGVEQFRPRAVIDLATLTGGVVVALGKHCAGLFCNDPALQARLETAGHQTGERLWPLPLWNEHRESMRGLHADLLNSNGSRDAHPIQGAAFLSFFVDSDAPTRMPLLPWAHLDIAGVADVEKDGPLFGRGPTGFGVRLLVEAISTRPA